MTEIPDLGMLFGQSAQPRLTPEQQAHAAAVSKAIHDAEMLAYWQVQFFAPVLCGCDKRYTPGEPRPPQLNCVVHGHMQMDERGRILMFGVPKEW